MTKYTLSNMKMIFMSVLLLSHISYASAQSDDCPTGSQSALSRVQSFLNEAAWVEQRQELGISVSADRARVLRDSRDLSVCQSLSKMFPKPDGKDRYFYKDGSYYFVIYEWNDQASVNIGSSGFIVLDDKFEVLRFYL